MKKKKKRRIILSILLIYVILVLYSMNTENPEGTALSGAFRDVEDLKLFYDLRYERDGENIFQGEIFEEELDFIDRAEAFLLVDLFLYNDEYDRNGVKYRSQVKEMTDRIIEKKKSDPNMQIYFITDPINNFYGSYTQREIKRLMDSGVEVTVTDHSRMKDSNPLYSGIWRAFIRPLGTNGKGYIGNFFQKDGPKVNIRSILYLANFKGNHRKVFISGNEALVASANPHDPSGMHSNVGVRFKGKAVYDLLQTENAILKAQEKSIPDFVPNFSEATADTRLRIVTDEEIGNTLDLRIDSLKAGDSASIGIFYLSDFKILKKLEEAASRGADIKIVADLNRDAFGMKKNGSPNRPALTELVEKAPNIKVRWYNTNGEQYHTKMAYFKYNTGASNLLLGSANFTRRNLRGYNYETDVEIEFGDEDELKKEIENYFDRIWNNRDGIYTLDLEEYREDGIILRNLWKIQEKLGICTW